jgi:hypothetical protein
MWRHDAVDAAADHLRVAIIQCQILLPLAPSFDDLLSKSNVQH